MAMNSSPAVLIGNVGRTPELRYTSSGQAHLRFSVAADQGYFDRTANAWVDRTSWFGVSVWRDLAERVAGNVQGGDRVVVVGRWEQRKYESEGVEREAIEVNADDVALSVRFADVKTTKVSRSATAGASESGAEEEEEEDDSL